jgi:hypothetical protein
MSGPPKISLSFGAPKKATPVAPIRLGGGLAKKPAINGNNRSRTALHDSDSEDETIGQHEEISHFDKAAGGAIHANGPSKTKGPLVIQVQANSDKIQYKRKGQQTSGLPIEANGEDIKLPVKQVTFGLTVVEKKTEEMNLEGEDMMEATPIVEVEKPKEKTEDETAMDALLGNKTSTKTIPLNEDEALHRDLADAQDAPTFEEYMAIPVSDFGAACLRGMGWKDTETLDTADDKPAANILKPKIHERRPALLGVGAKPSSAVGIELGEWGKNSKHKKGPDAAVGYNPVVLRNKVTGEMLTEAELEKQLKKQESVEQDTMVFEGEHSEKRVDRVRREDRNRSRREDDYRDRKHKESRRDDKRERSYRERHSTDDEKRDRKRRHRSTSRSPSRDQHKSRRYDDDRDRKIRSKYDDRPSKSDRRDRDRDREYESSSRRR